MAQGRESDSYEASYARCTSGFSRAPIQSPRRQMLLGPSALVFAFGVATTVFAGMVGRTHFERNREWWSRLNAWLLSFGTVWMIWIALAFFSFPLLGAARSHAEL